MVLTKGIQSNASKRLNAMKLRRLEDFHKRRLYAHVRHSIFGGNDHLVYEGMTAKEIKNTMDTTLLGPNLERFYENEPIMYHQTVNRKMQYYNIEPELLQDVFAYRAREHRWPRMLEHRFKFP